ncbi:MAG: sulfite exporter TauE/SafE family protein [Elusimicrobia bacterium]|nr:sulfite exporter TauE/SafE family protein [Elusimicrobiota bacterium]
MAFGIAAVAFLYSLVGHGGASGYLAIMSLAGVEPATMKVSALALNLLVAGIAFANYRKAGHFEPRLLWPFAAASIPAAYLGGRLDVPPRAYGALLGATLIFAAVRLWIPERDAEKSPAAPPLSVSLPAGALIGFVSGVVGVGGGIVLSPLMLLAGWADAKRTSAASAAFIWLNSAAGLAGHWHRFREAPVPWSWVLAAAAASAAGSALGARRLTGPVLRRCLSVVLALAAVKLLLA